MRAERESRGKPRGDQREDYRGRGTSGARPPAGPELDVLKEPGGAGWKASTSG